MANQLFATCLFLAMLQCSTVFAQEPPSKLHLDISAWLRRQPKNDDSWKDRTSFPYDAFISNASDDPKLLSFTTELGRFKQFHRGSAYDGSVRVDHLESLFIEKTTLTADQARQLEQIATERFTISNCDIGDEVAESLSGVRCKRIILKKLRLSDKALTTILSNQFLRGVEVEEIRGCTAEGWRGLAHLVGVSLTNCDFTDDAFRHLLECTYIELRNTQVTGVAMESLKTHSLQSLVLSGCPVSDKGLEKLQELPALVRLDLSGTAITDEGIRKLPEMPMLRHLNLNGTAITDEGLQKLPELPRLRELDLSGTAITDEGFQNFFVSPDLYEIRLTGTKVTKAWGVEFSRQHQGSNPVDKLRVNFQNDARWPPRGGLCMAGEFRLFK